MSPHNANTRRKNLVLLTVLMGLVALFYALTLVKVGGA